jgi:inosose dehydratase
MAQAGYAGTELGPYGYFPTEPATLQPELDRRGLRLCSAFVMMPLGTRETHPAGLAQVRRTAQLLNQVGCRLLILCDEITPDRCAAAGHPAEANRLPWTAQELKIAEEGIRAVMARCAEVGVQVAFHPHVGTHVETPEEVHRLFSLFAADELGLCLDTGHVVYGGGDPVALLERYITRVRCVHLKDVDADRLAEVRRHRLDFYQAVKQGVFTSLGQGTVDFSQVVALLRSHNFDGWVVVEQDVLPGGRGTDSPLANASAGRRFLRSLGV